MHPILFQFWGFTLPSFGVMLASAFFIGFIWTLRRASRAGESPDFMMEIYCWLIVAAIAGARLCYILFFPQIFIQNPLGVLFNQGGLVWYGGMVGVVALLMFYTQFRRLNFWRFGDILVPPAALGLALGRIGCMLAGCCYGSACDLPWAIHYPMSHLTHGIGVHPVQLYETIGLIGIIGLLLWIDRRKLYIGKTTCMFFVLYGFLRFALEYIRGDRLVWIDGLNLSASQVISLLFVAFGFLIMWQRKRHYKSQLLYKKRFPVASSHHAIAPSSV